MIQKHILFVDDEPTQQDLFKTAVADWNELNKAEDREFVLIPAADFDAGESAIENAVKASSFDGAFFDLRLGKDPVHGTPSARGNELAEKALRELGIPIAIITADDAYLSDHLLENAMVKAFDKNAELVNGKNTFDQAIEWLGEHWGMLEVLAQSKRQLSRSVGDIFVKRIWPRWGQIAEMEGEDQENVVKIVTRQYLTHMADFLGLDDPDNVSWHPYENYVSPALLSDRAHTGDIFKLGDECWVVLTPQCDMATRKIKNVILAQCVDGSNKWDEHIAYLKNPNASNSAKEKAEKFLRDHVNQNLEQKLHFLAPLPGDNKPVVVDFSKIMTLPLAELNERLDDRIASIASPFLSNIIQRFGAYISRTGQPNLDIRKF